MELPLQYDFDTSASQIKPVSDISTIATDLFITPVEQAADTDNTSVSVAPASEELSTASSDDTQTPPADLVAVEPTSSLPVDDTSGTDQPVTLPVDTQLLPVDIAIDPITSLPVDDTSGVDQPTTLPVDDTQLPTDVIAIDPVISLPVDDTSGTDLPTTPPVDDTQAPPTDIAVDQPIDMPIDPIYTFPIDFGGFISAGFIDYGWITLISEPLPIFGDITLAEPVITLEPLEPAVLDTSLNLAVSDNVVTDAPEVSLIGVPDISVQTF